MAGIVLEFDRNPALSDVERLQSFLESVQRAFNELEITMDDLHLEEHPLINSMTKGDFRILFDDYGHFKVVTANAVEAKKGDFKDLSADYARIDQTNIEQAWVEDLMVTGKFLVDDVNAATGSFSKYLAGVNIVGDNIKAGTISTDRLIIRDPETNKGILYEINNGIVDQKGLSEEEVKRLCIDGKILVAESVTADKINVTNLFAQDITSTGNFNMGGKGALVYDAKKDELSIRVKELYIGSDGKTLDGNYLISQINLDSTTARIKAKNIDLEGAVTISALDEKLGSNFVTDDEDVTRIDGGHIATKTIKAEQVDLVNLFAQEIESNGSIKGVTFIAEGGLSEENANESMVDFVKSLGGTPTLTASGALMTMFAGLSENADYLKSEHSAFGSRYKVESEKDQGGDNLGLHTGYDEHILDVNSFGINFRARKAGANNFTSLFKVDLDGAYWESSRLISQADLSKGINGKISRADEAEKDSEGNVIADTYLPMKGGVLEGDLHVKGNLSVDNREQLLTELLGYTPSYIQIRTTADGPAWSPSYQHFYPYHETAAPATWSNVKGSLTLDTNNVIFGDRVSGVNSYGVRIGENINMVRVHSNVTFAAEEESPSLVSATIYRWQKSTGNVLAFSQAWTHVEKNNGAYGTCTSEAIIAVQEGDFIFVGAYKGNASRDITTPAGNGRTNMIVEAIG